MSNPLAFPMYAINRADTDALWRAVQHLLAERGVPVSEGVPDDSLLAVFTTRRRAAKRFITVAFW